MDQSYEEFFPIFFSFLNRTTIYWATNEFHDIEVSFIGSIFISILFLIFSSLLVFKGKRKKFSKI